MRYTNRCLPYLTLLIVLVIVIVTDRVEVVVEADVEFEAVVRPRAELELARLRVERKVSDVDLTGRHEDRRWNPHDGPIMLDHTHCLATLFQSSVGTSTHTRTQKRHFRGSGHPHFLRGKVSTLTF